MDKTEELKQKWITGRTKIIGNMLDNPDKYGIYPTTKCFNALDKLHKKLSDEYAQQVSRDTAISFAEMFKHKYCSSMGDDMDDEFNEWLSYQNQ